MGGVGVGVPVGGALPPGDLTPPPPPPPPHAASSIAAETAVEFLMNVSRSLRPLPNTPTLEPPFASMPFGHFSRRHRPLDETRRCRPVSRRLETCVETGASVFRPAPWTCTPAPRPNGIRAGLRLLNDEVSTPRFACQRTAPLYAQSVNTINPDTGVGPETSSPYDAGLPRRSRAIIVLNRRAERSAGDHAQVERNGDHRPVLGIGNDEAPPERRCCRRERNGVRHRT